MKEEPFEKEQPNSYEKGVRMNNDLNEKIAKHLDKNIYDVITDLKNLQHSIMVYEKLSYLSGVLNKLANTESKFSSDFVADILEELVLICRELHQQKVKALAAFENQEFLNK